MCYKNHKMYLNIDEINLCMAVFSCSPIHIFRRLISRQHIFRRLISRFRGKISLSSLDSGNNPLDESLSSAGCSRFGHSDEPLPLFSVSLHHCFRWETCCGAPQCPRSSPGSHICAGVWPYSGVLSPIYVVPTSANQCSDHIEGLVAAFAG